MSAIVKSDLGRALDHMQQAAEHLEHALRALEEAHAKAPREDLKGRRELADGAIALAETRGRLVRATRGLYGRAKKQPEGTDARGEIASLRGAPETRLA